jgi:hypothetical protein
MKMKKIIILILFITGVANSLLAQKLTAEASKTSVAVGEPIQVTFSLNGNGTDLKIAHLNEFDLYQNPYSSSSTMVINGVVSQTYSLTYVIGAKKEGKVTLGPATITVNGTTIQSNTITFDVGKASSTQQNNSQNSGGGKSSNDNLILVAQPNKTKVYVGEALTLDYKILFRIDILNYSVPKLPSMDGCFVQDGKVAPQTTEIIDGKKYMSAGIKKLYVIPQRTGKVTIDPMEAEFVVRQQSGRRSNDIFDQIFGGGYEEVKYKLRSKPVIIDVMPLPEEHKPEGFSGAVGNYTFKATISKDKVKANEAINITVTVTGKGNVKLIDPLKINFPEDFETYDPKITQNTNAADALNGSKTFDYTIIPRHEGDYKIDHLDFSYFDPEKKAYVVLPSPEFNIHVDKGDPNDVNANVYTPQNKEEVKVLGDDIRYIRTAEPDLKSSEDFFFGSPGFFAGLLLPLLAFIAFLFIRKKNIEKNKDAIAVKGRKATKMARKRLVAAEQNLKAANKEKFYIEISQALYGYVSDKLNISIANLTKENITNTLRARGVADTVIENLITTIDTCEYARYAPNAVSGDLQTIYNNTVELITKLENEIR